MLSRRNALKWLGASGLFGPLLRWFGPKQPLPVSPVPQCANLGTPPLTEDELVRRMAAAYRKAGILPDVGPFSLTLDPVTLPPKYRPRCTKSASKEMQRMQDTRDFAVDYDWDAGRWQLPETAVAVRPT